MGKLSRAAALASITLAAACTTSQTAVPPLAGPSEFALSLRMTATPDSLSQDGASQSSIQVQAFDPNGKGVSGLPLRIDMGVNGLIQDYGTLSARTIVTGTDGRASTVYTAPPPPSATAGGGSTVVTLLATPTGTDFAGANPQIVSIRLIPPGVVLPPASTPTARFTFGKPVNMNVPALFDGSSSCPRGLDASGNCLPPSNQGATITSYSWSFGDGGTATGQTATHAFRTIGSFNVTLTVTNDRGVSASSTQAVTVEVTAAPTGDIVVSPTTPVIGDKVLFNASGIQAAPGHSITQYSWDFGDPNAGAGNNASGPSVSHVYNSPGAYNVVLTVTDDTGQTKTFTKSLTVGNGQPKALFTFAIINAITDTVQVDGSGSSAAGTASIVSYSWSWGDGSAAGSGQVATHSYFASGPVTITLTVTDSLGRVGTTSQTVTLP
jgi:PKD repeat protein